MTVMSFGGGMSDTADNWPVLNEQAGSADRDMPEPVMERRRVDGDALAAELFAAHYGRLAGWCRKLLDDDDTAHEVAMEAFTRLLGRLRRVDDPVGYLYVIAANLVRDHWRKTKREREAFRYAKQTEQLASSDGTRRTDLRTLVESLPERLRVTVLLYYYAGLPLNGVARLTNRPVGTVKSDLFQARSVLRQALDGAR
jgi:RNA polymerase sigma-70 factor (ECF subfamily)